MSSALIRIGILEAEMNKIAEKWASRYEKIVQRKISLNELLIAQHVTTCPHCGAKKE